MPDQYGRVGYEDLMGIANALNVINGIGQQKSAFGMQKKQYEQGQADRDEAKIEKGQYRSAMGSLASGGAMPEEIPADIQAKAKVDHMTGLQAGQQIDNLEEMKAVKGRQDEIFNWMRQNQNQPIEKIPANLTAGTVGHKALAASLYLQTNTKKAQSALIKARKPIIDQKFNNFSVNRSYINNALSTGNTQEAVNGVRQMAKDLPIPYQLGEFNEENQTFEVLYFDRRTDQMQSSGTKSMSEAIKEMNAIGQKEFTLQAAQHMEAKRLENLKAEANPIHGKTQGGTAVLVVPQVRVWEPDGGVSVRVRNEETGEMIAEYGSWDAFYESGASVENLDRQGALKDIAYKDQQIETSKAQMDKYNAEKGESSIKTKKERVDLSNKELTRDKKSLSLVLEPFKQGKAELFAEDEDGNVDFSSAGRGAMQKAFEFYEKNKGKENLTDTDQIKFNKSVDAIRLYQNITDRISKGYKISAMDSGDAGSPGKDVDGMVKSALDARKKGKDELKSYLATLPVDKRKTVIAELRKLATATGGGNKSAMGGGTGPDPAASMVEPGQPQPEGANKSAFTAPNDFEGTAYETPAGEESGIRSELPQDMSQWDVQEIPVNGKRVYAVITENGPVELTPEELEAYKRFSADVRNKKVSSALDWAKRNMTGTKTIPKEGVFK